MSLSALTHLSLRHLAALGLLAVSPLSAQVPQGAATHSLTGTVFDSVAGSPLVGAIVQVALGEAVPRVFTTQSDAVGHFRIDGLPSGRYGVVFQHDALNALGLESPLRAVELADDSSATLDLGVPSGATVRAQRCPGPASDGDDGMMVGYLDAALDNGVLLGATVDVRWVEITFPGGAATKTTRHVLATSGTNGTYLACRVPSDAPVEVSVSHDGYRSIVAQVVVPSAGVLRQDFHLAVSDVFRGAASVAGRVVQDDGRLLANGRATIATLAMDVPVADGRFTITGLPQGTWPVEVRAIGYEPLFVLVHALEHGSVPVTVSVTRRAQSLEAVNVIGRASRDTRTLSDLIQRTDLAVGTAFLPGNSWLKAADRPGDVLRAARGFSYQGPVKMKIAGCNPMRSYSGDNIADKATKGLAVYLDGQRLGTGLQGLQDAIMMKDVLAIETYPDVQFAPFQWRKGDTCAVMAVWTKR